MTMHPDSGSGQWLINAKNITIGDSEDLWTKPIMVNNNIFDVIVQLMTAQALGKLLSPDIDLIGKSVSEKYEHNRLYSRKNEIGITKLYRVMSQNEYDDIIKNGGKFNYPPAGPIMEEKWFATTVHDAELWGSKFYTNGDYRIIEIELPSNALNQMYYNSHLDGIGPAYAGSIDWLNSLIKGVKTIK